MQAPIDILKSIYTSGIRGMANDILNKARYLLSIYPIHSAPTRTQIQTDTLIRKYSRKADMYAAKGKISKAARLVDMIEALIESGEQGHIDRPVPPSQAELESKLRDLYPLGSATDDEILHLFDDGHNDNDPLVLDYESVRDALQHRRPDSAKGHSGWTNILLRQMVTTGTEDQRHRFAYHVTEMFNLLLASRMPRCVH